MSIYSSNFCHSVFFLHSSLLELQFTIPIEIFNYFLSIPRFFTISDIYELKIAYFVQYLIFFTFFLFSIVVLFIHFQFNAFCRSEWQKTSVLNEQKAKQKNIILTRIAQIGCMNSFFQNRLILHSIYWYQHSYTGSKNRKFYLIERMKLFKGFFIVVCNGELKKELSTLIHQHNYGE